MSRVLLALWALFMIGFVTGCGKECDVNGDCPQGQGCHPDGYCVDDPAQNPSGGAGGGAGGSGGMPPPPPPPADASPPPPDAFVWPDYELTGDEPLAADAGINGDAEVARVEGFIGSFKVGEEYLLFGVSCDPDGTCMAATENHIGFTEVDAYIKTLGDGDILEINATLLPGFAEERFNIQLGYKGFHQLDTLRANMLGTFRQISSHPDDILFDIPGMPIGGVTTVSVWWQLMAAPIVIQPFACDVEPKQFDNRAYPDSLQERGGMREIIPLYTTDSFDEPQQKSTTAPSSLGSRLFRMMQCYKYLWAMELGIPTPFPQYFVPADADPNDLLNLMNYRIVGPSIKMFYDIPPDYRVDSCVALPLPPPQ